MPCGTGLLRTAVSRFFYASNSGWVGQWEAVSGWEEGEVRVFFFYFGSISVGFLGLAVSILKAVVPDR